MKSRNRTTKSKYRTRLVLALVASASMLLAACSSPAKTAGADELTVRVAAGATGPFTSQFNPLLNASKDASGNSSYVIFEPLMVDDVANSQSKPWLATSGDWSNGGKTLTIKLRNDVMWSDGQPMTGEDVAFTFRLMGKYPALNFYGLPVASATSPDPATTVVTFTKPAFQYLWSNTTPVPEHLWKDVADPVKYTNPQPVGTGPFALKSFSPQAITLERNSHYWGEQPKVNTAQYLAFDSESSMLAALQAGQVDWITTGTADPAAIAKQAPSKIGYWSTNPSPAMIFLYPNDAQAPTNDAHLRLAISEAIDRAKVSKLAFGDKNAPAESPTGLDPKSRAKSIAPEYKDLTFSSAGAEAAKQTLISAGYTAGTSGTFTAPDGKPLQLTLTVPTTNPYGDWVRAGQAIAADLAAAGIPTTLKTEAQPAWHTDTSNGNYQLTLRALGGILPVYDLYSRIFSQNELTPLGKSANVNYQRYTNPQAGKLLADFADSAPNSAGETTALAGLEKLMVSQAPIIPLFHISGVGMWRTDRFTGWPSQTDQYAVPTGNHNNAEEVLTAIRPAGTK
ncbi:MULTISPECIES: ABC transporter substrate-binding protein [Arthrobacter]|nr:MULTISPECIES: ABC transporter substrate-binding protein [Arthrobacter]